MTAGIPGAAETDGARVVSGTCTAVNVEALGEADGTSGTFTAASGDTDGCTITGGEGTETGMAIGEDLAVAKAAPSGNATDSSGVTVGSTGRTGLGPFPCPIGPDSDVAGVFDGRRLLTMRMGNEMARDTRRRPKKVDSITDTRDAMHRQYATDTGRIPQCEECTVVYGEKEEMI